MNILHIQVVQLKSQGAIWEAEGAGNTGQDLGDVLGMSALLTGPDVRTLLF